MAGVSRQPGQAANAVFRKLRGAGYEVFPINPKTSEVEGARCYSDVGSVPVGLKVRKTPIARRTISIANRAVVLF